MPISLGELAERFGCELIGDPDVVVDSVGSLSSAGPGTIAFLTNPAMKDDLRTTKAAAVIVRAEDAADVPTAALIDPNPRACYARMASVICPGPVFEPGIHPAAVVSAEASVAASAHVAANAVIEAGTQIGEKTVVGPGAVIGPDCDIGNDCRLHANVTLVRDVTMGARCIIHSGTAIGADGFGQAMTPEGWVKVPQLGGVRIGDDVEVGAGTTIDCGAVGDTVIGNGVRIDNQIQIAHNVQVGEHTVLVAGVAIAGSARIGRRCILAGMVGVSDHVEICDDVIINGKAMISSNITEPGTYAGMFPAEPVKDWNRRVARFRRIEKLIERVGRLEKDAK